MAAISRLVFGLLLLLVCWACESSSSSAPDNTRPPPVTPPPADLRVHLQWYPDRPEVGQVELRTGVAWLLSQLGAGLPTGSLAAAWTDVGQNQFELDLAEVGFDERGETVWLALLEVIRGSGLYQERGAIDLGRFIMLTLGSAQHYYALTGAHATLAGYLEAHPVDQFGRFGVAESCIAFGNRLVRFQPVETRAELVYLAREGTGSLSSGDFSPTDAETVDFMANGQARYAIYDDLGRLKSAADPAFTEAGKPAKCMWCHEHVIQPPFCARTDVAETTSIFEYLIEVARAQDVLDAYRAELDDEIQFENLLDHAQVELLYVTFMEPSLARIAAEWAMTESEVQSRLADITTHLNAEYPELGPRYHRGEVDARSPLAVIQVPESARDFSFFEPDLIDAATFLRP